jgi:hypothetical protein
VDPTAISNVQQRLWLSSVWPISPPLVCPCIFWDSIPQSVGHHHLQNSCLQNIQNHTSLITVTCVFVQWHEAT